jgi:signal transduction histidine kinase
MYRGRPTPAGPPATLDLDALRITVRDTGEGIAPDILGSIFEPYFTTRSSGRGTGLGLAVVHGLVKSLGGDIDVKARSARAPPSPCICRSRASPLPS